MSDPPGANHPVGEAMQWVARITAVGIEMVLPGLAGQWLDRQFGTSPFLVLSGFILGIVAGMWHLLVMTKAIGAGAKRTTTKTRDDADDNDKEVP